jgi:acetyl-CoA synthetase (ADP-forming)
MTTPTELPTGGGALGETQAKDLIDKYGVPTPRRRIASSWEDAVVAFETLRPPVAVKLISNALHKTDVGGVRLGINDIEALNEAITQIASSAAAARVSVQGYLIEEMAPSGIEVLVGGVVDPIFGPAIIVGLGGIFAEVLDDIAARICPISIGDAIEMIHETKVAPLLSGARGATKMDVAALARIVVAIGGERGLLVEHAKRIQEIDINPVIVSPVGAVAVDARIILQGN